MIGLALGKQLCNLQLAQRSQETEILQVGSAGGYKLCDDTVAAINALFD